MKAYPVAEQHFNPDCPRDGIQCVPSSNGNCVACDDNNGLLAAIQNDEERDVNEQSVRDPRADESQSDAPSRSESEDIVSELRGIPALTLDCPLDIQIAIDDVVIRAADYIEANSER